MPNKETSCSLGSRIKELRMDRGLTVRHLADIVGVTQGFISQLENSASGVSDEVFTKIAQALDVVPSLLRDPRVSIGKIDALSVLYIRVITLHEQDIEILSDLSSRLMRIPHT